MMSLCGDPTWVRGPRNDLTDLVVAPGKVIKEMDVPDRQVEGARFDVPS